MPVEQNDDPGDEDRKTVHTGYTWDETQQRWMPPGATGFYQPGAASVSSINGGHPAQAMPHGWEAQQAHDNAGAARNVHGLEPPCGGRIPTTDNMFEEVEPGAPKSTEQDIMDRLEGWIRHLQEQKNWIDLALNRARSAQHELRGGIYG